MLREAIRTVLPRSSLGYVLPAPEFMYHMLEQTKFTPDIAVLESYEWQLLFAPDELKTDHTKHTLLGEESRYKFPGFTQKMFQFWEPPTPFVSPIPLETTDSFVQNITGFPPAARIKGEVHLVRPQRFMELDRFRQNTVEFRRQRIRLIVPFRHVEFLKDHNLYPEFGAQGYFGREGYSGRSVRTSTEITCTIRAWMYIGIPSYWDPLITTFDYKAVETFTAKARRWCQEYYNIRRPPLPPK